MAVPKPQSRFLLRPGALVRSRLVGNLVAMLPPLFESDADEPG